MSVSSLGNQPDLAYLTKKAKPKEPQTDPNLYPPYLQKLEVKYPSYTRDGDIEYPFEETSGVGDENRIRGNWSSKSDYLLSAIGFTVGLGNLWRFPVLVFRHGGAAFLVAYITVLIFAALPMVFMEIILGQFSSLGAVSVWKVVPLFKGVGIASVLVMCLIAVYLNVVSAWSLFYVINSVSFSLPWSNCENSWSGLNCTFGARMLCSEQSGILLSNGSCVTQPTNSSPSVLITTFQDQHSIPSIKYFHEDVLMLSSSFDEIGTLNWYLGICVLITWIAVFLCLFQGVKSSGKVVYVVVLLPFIIIAVLLARLLTLPGSWKATLFFLQPDWMVLQDPRVWGEASVHAFYSLSCCTGGLVTLASYTKFHNKLFCDVWTIVTVDFLASIACCFLTFSAIGFTCFQFNIPLDKFQIQDGIHLVFVFLAEALAGVPVAPLYTGLFFLMVLLMIHSTQLFVVETIVTAICDEFPERLRKNRRHVLTIVCAVFILLSIPFCLSAGLYWLLLLQKYTITWPLVAVAFLECMAISWIYGIDNLLDNAKWITGAYPPFYVFWKILWKFLCPVIYLAILCFLWLEWQSVSYESYVFPYWTSLLGWSISLFPLIFVPIVGMYQICSARGSIAQKWYTVLYPDDAWGPALAVHRAEQFPLQIPEARRLLLPPEVEVGDGNGGGGSPGPMPHEDDEDQRGNGYRSESVVDREGSKSGGLQYSRRSVAATINSVPTFERETAI